MPTSKEIVNTFAREVDKAFTSAVAQGANYNEMVGVLFGAAVLFSQYHHFEDVKRLVKKEKEKGP